MFLQGCEKFSLSCCLPPGCAGEVMGQRLLCWGFSWKRVVTLCETP